jgi:hypothetical protein
MSFIGATWGSTAGWTAATGRGFFLFGKCHIESGLIKACLELFIGRIAPFA